METEAEKTVEGREVRVRVCERNKDGLRRVAPMRPAWRTARNSLHRSQDATIVCPKIIIMKCFFSV